MKTIYSSPIGRILFAILTCLSLVGRTQAQVVTLAHNNSVARIDLSNPNPGLVGMFDWAVQGQDQLRQQWFWFAIGGNPELPINTISPPAFSTFLGTRGLSTTYANAALSISIDYLLTGGSFALPGGAAQSDISESISIQNTSGTNMLLRFYQYSDFDLASPANDTVILGTDPFGQYNSANQSDGISVLTEQVSVTAPSATHGEAAFFNATWVKLNNGLPDVLNDNPAAGAGNVTWALQWNIPLVPNEIFLISKDKHLTVQVIPEPGSGTVVLLGLGVLVIARRFVRS